MIVRNILLADTLPDDIAGKIGFQKGDLQPDLTWVAVEGVRVVGILVAFAAHRWFYPFRIVVSKRAPRHTMRHLCRKAFRDATQRGYNSYVTCVENDETGRRLLRILETRGRTAAHDSDDVWIGGEIAGLLAPSKPEHLEVKYG